MRHRFFAPQEFVESTCWANDELFINEPTGTHAGLAGTRYPPACLGIPQHTAVFVEPLPTHTNILWGLHLPQLGPTVANSPGCNDRTPLELSKNRGISTALQHLALTILQSIETTF